MPQTSFTSRFASSSRYLDSTSAVTLPDNRAVEKSPWNDSTTRPWAASSSQSTGSIAPSTLPASTLPAWHARASLLYLAWLYSTDCCFHANSHGHMQSYPCEVPCTQEYRYSGMASHISGQLSRGTHLSRRHHPLYSQALQRVSTEAHPFNFALAQTNHVSAETLTWPCCRELILPSSTRRSSLCPPLLEVGNNGRL